MDVVGKRKGKKGKRWENEDKKQEVRRMNEDELHGY